MSAKHKVKGLGVLHQGSVESIYGDKVLRTMAAIKFGNIPGAGTRTAAWIPKGQELRDLQYETGRVWAPTKYTPEEVAGAIMAVDNMQFVRPSWAVGKDTIERATRALTVGKLNAAAYLNVSVEVLEQMNESEASVEVSDAISFAHAVIRGAGVATDDLEGVRVVMRSQLGNLRSYARCVLSGMDPIVLHKFGSEAKEELVEAPALQCVLRRYGVDVDTILRL